jgi:hypothetical protein
VVATPAEFDPPTADDPKEDVATLTSKFLGESKKRSNEPEATISGSLLSPSPIDKTKPKHNVEKPRRPIMSEAVQPLITPTVLTKKTQIIIKAVLLIAIPKIFIKKLVFKPALFLIFFFIAYKANLISFI